MSTATSSSRAAFVIYKDEPSSPTRPKSAPSSPAACVTGRLNIASAGDKENVDPVTGLPPTAEQVAKKRKTGVLAIKPIVASKGHKDAQPETKKRKLSLASKTRTEKKEKKEKRSSTRKSGGGSSRPRKAAELPSVQEEIHADEQDRVAQAAVDSRCYELTVLPLADVSPAYEPPTLDDGLFSSSEKVKAPIDAVPEEPEAKTKAVAKRPSSPVPSTSKEEPQPSPIRPSNDYTVFSTPERERIYSTFTFSSPSPAGERYAVASRSSVERFSDLKFDPTLDRAL